MKDAGRLGSLPVSTFCRAAMQACRRVAENFKIDTNFVMYVFSF